MKYLITMIELYKDERAPKELEWLQRTVQRETDYFKPGVPFSELKIDGKRVLINSEEILKVEIISEE